MLTLPSTPSRWLVSHPYLRARASALIMLGLVSAMLAACDAGGEPGLPTGITPPNSSPLAFQAERLRGAEELEAAVIPNTLSSVYWSISEAAPTFAGTYFDGDALVVAHTGQTVDLDLVLSLLPAWTRDAASVRTERVAHTFREVLAVEVQLRGIMGTAPVIGVGTYVRGNRAELVLSDLELRGEVAAALVAAGVDTSMVGFIGMDFSADRDAPVGAPPDVPLPGGAASTERSAACVGGNSYSLRDCLRPIRSGQEIGMRTSSGTPFPGSSPGSYEVCTIGNVGDPKATGGTLPVIITASHCTRKRRTTRSSV